MKKKYMYIYFFGNFPVAGNKNNNNKKRKKKLLQELNGLLPILTWALCHNTSIVLGHGGFGVQVGWAMVLQYTKVYRDRGCWWLRKGVSQYT